MRRASNDTFVRCPIKLLRCNVVIACGKFYFWKLEDRVYETSRVWHRDRWNYSQACYSFFLLTLDHIFFINPGSQCPLQLLMSTKLTVNKLFEVLRGLSRRKRSTSICSFFTRRTLKSRELLCEFDVKSREIKEVKECSHIYLYSMTVFINGFNNATDRTKRIYSAFKFNCCCSQSLVTVTVSVCAWQWTLRQVNWYYSVANCMAEMRLWELAVKVLP